MKLRSYSLLGLIPLAAQCAPAGCSPVIPPISPPPPTTTTTLPPVVVPDRGFMLCIDFDGGQVTQLIYNEVKTFTVEPSGLDQNTINSILDHARLRFAPWSVQIHQGECERGPRVAIMHVTTQPAPEQSLVASGTNGYAMIGGWGLPQSDDGFVFTRYLGTPTMKADVVHEAGHMAGLPHPAGLERSIMGDPNDPSLNWSDGDRAKLTSFFSS